MSDVNPYAAPEETESVATEGSNLIGGKEIASQNRRFVNFIVDNIAVQVLAGIGGGIVGAASAVGGGGPVPPADMFRVQMMGAAVGLLISLGYFCFMESLFGVTVGKLLTGTRVVNGNGDTASFGQILGRSLARMIPFEPFSFLFGDKTTGWHDSLSGTRVVRK